MIRILLRSLALSVLLFGCVSIAAAQDEVKKPKKTTPKRAQPTLPTVEGVEYFQVKSKLLSEFWGRTMIVEAGVVLPPGYKPDGKTPVCYSIHGFGGSHKQAWRFGKRLRKMIAEQGYPPMVYVFLNAHFPLGHHEFADSVNNGPWGKALTTEFIPAFEKKYSAPSTASSRFLTGHSSGGWSSLWLQVTYPELFGGTWSTAPDSIDFRHFTGIDVYNFENAYVDPDGKPINLVRKSDGSWGPTIRDYAQAEHAKKKYGGQFASFDAVFSPREIDGRPMKMFDRDSGAINKAVLKSWEKYDICLQLRRNWKQLGPKLEGKIKIYVGTLDTYRLEGAVLLAQAELKTLGSDAQFTIVEGRNHGSLMAPHKTLWPKGLMYLIHAEMWAKWKSQNGGAE